MMGQDHAHSERDRLARLGEGYGLLVLLDPLWSKTGPRGPNYREFLGGGANAASDLAFLKERFDAIHWHNEWQATPDPGSPYRLWLNELERSADLQPAAAAT